MVSQVQLFFRGENLADTDIFSKSDPYCVVEEAQQSGGWTEVGRTECINDDLNPKFSSSVGVEYHFGRKQLLRVRVFDEDGHQSDNDNDKLGSCEFLLQNIITARNATVTFQLQPQGKIHVTGTLQEEGGSGAVQMTFGARSLSSIDFVKKKPYFKLSKMLPNGALRLLHRSIPLDTSGGNTLWDPVSNLSLEDYCEDVRQPCLLFEAFSSGGGGSTADKPCGSFKASVSNFQEVSADCANRGIKLKDVGTGKREGEIYLNEVTIDHSPQFAEYLKNGFEINLAVAIDFAGCNPNSPKSLHYMGSPMGGAPFLNQFARSILAVGETLMPYDSDQIIPVYGFGAIPRGCDQQLTSDFFHCNGDPNTPDVYGMDGILDAYRHSADTVKQGEASNFSQTIEDVAATSRQRGGGGKCSSSYTILLIITDGESPSDLQDTVDAIVAASDAALSIVIVGVGHGEFSAFELLDGDRELPQSSNGTVASRDIVQFVPFKQYERKPAEELAAAVLQEIPEQFVGWARVAGLSPSMVRRGGGRGGNDVKEAAAPPKRFIAHDKRVQQRVPAAAQKKKVAMGSSMNSSMGRSNNAIGHGGGIPVNPAPGGRQQQPLTVAAASAKHQRDQQRQERGVPQSSSEDDADDEEFSLDD